MPHARFQTSPAGARPAAGRRRARLHATDPHPGAEPARHPRRPRRHRAGTDRQRQDRRVRPGPAAPAGRGDRAHPGAGAVPHARTGRPGGAAAAQAGGGPAQPQGPDAVRRPAAGAADPFAGSARSARGGRHAGPHPGTAAQEGAAPGQRAHAGAGRGRPHVGHGLRGADPRDHRQDAEGPPEPAVLGHLHRRHPRHRPQYPA